MLFFNTITIIVICDGKKYFKTKIFINLGIDIIYALLSTTNKHFAFYEIGMYFLNIFYLVIDNKNITFDKNISVMYKQK